MSSRVLGRHVAVRPNIRASSQETSPECAAGGTIFLDEMGDIAIELQPKLLRFIEQQEVYRLGEAKPVKVDVRIVAATNANLEQLVAQGRFREDLLYRLKVLPLHLPPLRERREEIPGSSSTTSRSSATSSAKGA